MKPDPCREVAARFDVAGRYLGSERLASGHIHETWRGRFAGAGGRRSAVFQRLNRNVFPEPHLLMANLLALTRALREGRGEEAARRVPRVVETRAGGVLLQDARGDCWRCFDFIEGSRSIDRAEGPGDAFAAARAFGDFARRLARRPPRLAEVLPGFHHTPARLAHLERAARLDPRARRAGVAAEWRQVQRLAPLAPVLAEALASARIPTRIAHNDAKIGNVLFDADSGEALCVVDLDTVMPGTPLFDFGDLVRTATCRAPEDCPDPARVEMEPELYDAVREGFLAGAAGLLGEEEVALMPSAAVLIAFETGVRFLADYLNGDTYFRVRHAEQNLHRARCQLRLAASVARRLGVRL